MGMFQPQNYGNDFIGAMSATTGMLNEQRRTDLAAKEIEQRSKDRAAEAETRALTNEGLKQDNALKVAKVDREKALQAVLPHLNNVLEDKLDPKDKARFAGATEELLKEIPYTPDTLSGFTPEYMSNISSLARGVSELSTLPAGNYKYTVEDGVPEINKTLQGFNSLLSKDRLGKTFTDADGSVTGKPGSTYKTVATHGFMMMSGEGNKAGFVPLFSVADENGKPIVGADGRAVTVPSTEDGSNGPNAKLRIVTPEELMTKLGFVNKLAAVAQKLNTPEARKEYVRGQLPSYMEPEDGAKALAKSLEPQETKLQGFGPEQDIYDQNMKLVRAGTPKEKEDKAPTTRTVKRNGYEVAEEYVGDGKWKVVAQNKIKEPQSASEKEAKGAAAGQKRSIKEIVDEYQAIKVKRNDQFAKDTEELRKVNAERAQMQEPPLTMEQYFKGKESPAHRALTQNMYQLRDVAKNSYGYDLVNMAPFGNGAPAKGMAAPAQAKPAPKQMASVQSKAKPITATNGQTGQRIVSYDNGASWQPLK